MRRLTKSLTRQSRSRRTHGRPREHPDIAAWLKANEKPLPGNRGGDKEATYFNPLITRKTDKGSNGRWSVSFCLTPKSAANSQSCLTARAMLHTGEGKFDDAWQDLLACHRLGRLVARGGTSIESLVGHCIEVAAITADLAFVEPRKVGPEAISGLPSRLAEIAALALDCRENGLLGAHSSSSTPS